MLEGEIHAIARKLLELGYANKVKVSVAKEAVMNSQNDRAIRIVAREEQRSPATVCLQ